MPCKNERVNGDGDEDGRDKRRGSWEFAKETGESFLALSLSRFGSLVLRHPSPHLWPFPTSIFSSKTSNLASRGIQLLLLPVRSISKNSDHHQAFSWHATAQRTTSWPSWPLGNGVCGFCYFLLLEAWALPQLSVIRPATEPLKAALQ